MKRRILGSRDTNYYHVMSRVVNGDFVFGAGEKAFFLLTMRKLETFMGVRILTYCLMSNHFHLLVEVPKIESISDEKLLKRIRAFYSRGQAAEIEQTYHAALATADADGNGPWIDEWRATYLSRMGSLSCFTKELKERFSTWYNRKHSRRGTLWQERFKSVLVENSDHVLLTMAAYIDLNPVRAGLVDDPANYRFCGYAEAVAGGLKARDGLTELAVMHGQKASWKSTASLYRKLLFCVGEKMEGRNGFDPAETQRVLDAGGELSLGQLLHCKVRYFSDGVALGSQLFIDEVFFRNRTEFGERRKTGARKLAQGENLGLYSLRNLRKNAICAAG